jgi:hypothetical protein
MREQQLSKANARYLIQSEPHEAINLVWQKKGPRRVGRDPRPFVR